LRFESVLVRLKEEAAMAADVCEKIENSSPVPEANRHDDSHPPAMPFLAGFFRIPGGWLS
jgi:hypothetical protein